MKPVRRLLSGSGAGDRLPIAEALLAKARKVAAHTGVDKITRTLSIDGDSISVQTGKHGDLIVIIGRKVRYAVLNAGYIYKVEGETFSMLSIADATAEVVLALAKKLAGYRQFVLAAAMLNHYRSVLFTSVLVRATGVLSLGNMALMNPPTVMSVFEQGGSVYAVVFGTINHDSIKDEALAVSERFTLNKQIALLNLTSQYEQTKEFTLTPGNSIVRHGVTITHSAVSAGGDVDFPLGEDTALRVTGTMAGSTYTGAASVVYAPGVRYRLDQTKGVRSSTINVSTATTRYNGPVDVVDAPFDVTAAATLEPAYSTWAKVSALLEAQSTDSNTGFVTLVKTTPGLTHTPAYSTQNTLLDVRGAAGLSTTAFFGNDTPYGAYYNLLCYDTVVISGDACRSGQILRVDAGLGYCTPSEIEVSESFDPRQQHVFSVSTAGLATLAAQNTPRYDVTLGSDGDRRNFIAVNPEFTYYDVVDGRAIPVAKLTFQTELNRLVSFDGARAPYAAITPLYASPKLTELSFSSFRARPFYIFGTHYYLQPELYQNGFDKPTVAPDNAEDVFPQLAAYDLPRITVSNGVTVTGDTGFAGSATSVYKPDGTLAYGAGGRIDVSPINVQKAFLLANTNGASCGYMDIGRAYGAVDVLREHHIRQGCVVKMTSAGPRTFMTAWLTSLVAPAQAVLTAATEAELQAAFDSLSAQIGLWATNAALVDSQIATYSSPPSSAVTDNVFSHWGRHANGYVRDYSDASAPWLGSFTKMRYGYPDWRDQIPNLQRQADAYADTSKKTVAEELLALRNSGDRKAINAKAKQVIAANRYVILDEIGDDSTYYGVSSGTLFIDD